MKKLSALVILLCCCLFLNGFICVAPASPATAETDKVLEARLGNLLNINTVYGDDFLDNQKLVNAAMIMLKGYADDEGFVKNEIVSTYIKDMYDIDVDINENINAGLPQKEGYVLLIPRGHSVYTHDIISVTDMEDFLLVVSEAQIRTHDGEVHTAECVTKVIENEQSIFGFSILDSVLTEKSAAFTRI